MVDNIREFLASVIGPAYYLIIGKFDTDHKFLIILFSDLNYENSTNFPFISLPGFS